MLPFFKKRKKGKIFKKKGFYVLIYLGGFDIILIDFDLLRLGYYVVYK